MSTTGRSRTDGPAARRRKPAAIAAGLLLACWALPARAQITPAPSPSPAEPQRAASEHRERAVRLFNLQEYGPAVEEFKASYKLDPKPDLLYAIGQAERLRGDCDKAIGSYEAFLRSGPPERESALARKQIALCQEERTARAAGSAALAAPQGQPAAPVAAAGPTSPLAASPAPRRFHADTLGNVLVIGGMAALAGGGTLWWMGRDAIRQANHAAGYADFSSRAGGLDAADIKQRVGAGGMIAGGALVAAGVIRYLTRPSGEGSAVAAVVAAPGGSGPALVVSGVF